MEYIYIIVQNGIAYDKAFTAYNLAVNEVKTKHQEILAEQEKECNEFGLRNFSEVDLVENKSGKTDLYIEKQIYITIYKLPIIK
jgi:hypothetical protein